MRHSIAREKLEAQFIKHAEKLAHIRYVLCLPPEICVTHQEKINNK